MRRGFTLVELSIVLVIIGLLIGGILVAQSMISTAKVQKFVRQVQQFDTAVMNFQTKYNGLPGDSSAFGCTNASNKCNNRIIEDAGGNAPGYVQYFSSEPANFWPNLQQSGFANPGGNNLTSAITGGFSVAPPNPNSPVMALGDKTGIIPWSTTIGILNPQYSYYLIANWTTITSGVTDIWTPAPIAPISVFDAQAVDSKMDDGVPNAGTVYGFGTVNAWTQNGTCLVAGKYNVSDSTDKCMLAVRMLSQSGGT